MIVIKLGGTKGLDFSAICSDLADIIKVYPQIILVHGGSSETNRLGELLGTPPKFITSPSGFSSRYTDRITLEIFTMAVNGKINTFLVEELHRKGINAFGLSGLDGRLLVATRKKTIQSIENGKRKIIHDDFTGRIDTVNRSILIMLLESGFLPVVAPLAISTDHEAVNVDADRAAAMIAASVQADQLILLTGVPGLLREFPDERTLISSLNRQQLTLALEFSQGRMKKKILASEEALTAGVRQVIISDGRTQHPLIDALNGKGTLIK